MSESSERLLAYSSKLTASAGSTLEIFVSCPHDHFDVSVEAVAGGTSLPGAPLQLATRPLRSLANGRYPGGTQAIHPGSYCWSTVESFGAAGSFALRVTARPSARFTGGPQTLLAVQSFTGASARLLLTDEGVLTGRLETAGKRSVEVVAAYPLDEWFDAELQLDFERGRLTLRIRSATLDTEASAPAHPLSPADFDGAAVISAAASVQLDGWEGTGPLEGHRITAAYNGKLEAPCISRLSGDGDILAWDFGDWSDPILVPDRSGNGFDGRMMNSPLRAVTGAAWTGSATDWRVRPDQYAAARFHEDALTDARWRRSFDLPIESSWASGLYVVRITAGPLRYDLPIFVTSVAAERTARVAFLASTFTYLAYSNLSTLATEELEIEGDGAVRNDVTGFVTDNPWLGHSLYDRHRDGTGIHHVSHLRPMPDLQPNQPSWVTGGGWGLSADVALLSWLDAEGIEVELITDHDLDDLGAAGLDGFDVLITGSHPEYVSDRLYEAVTEFHQRGGRTMYLGGNGFYWVVRREGVDREVVEVRRGYSATRAWESESGEVHHLDGQPGGLWRHRGRPPQRQLLVGFTGQGFSDAAPYEWSPGIAANPRIEFIVRGLDSVTGRFGEGGGILGGAAGEEIDRVDFGLGSPRHTVVLASSAGLHSDNYLQVVEDCYHLTSRMSGTTSPAVRADVAFAETPSGGAVFATGSIDWIAYLAAEGLPDESIRTITRNVLERFLDPEPFTIPDARG